MDEAEQLCDRLVIMDEARIVAEGSPRGLIEQYATREVVELRFHTTDEKDAAFDTLQGGDDKVESLPDRIVIYADDGDRVAATSVEAGGLNPATVLVRRSTLEDVFLTIAGRSLED
jgi:lipooligosaccharide transport system ATP-binding protein